MIRVNMILLDSDRGEMKVKSKLNGMRLDVLKVSEFDLPKGKKVYTEFVKKTKAEIEKLENIEYEDNDNGLELSYARDDKVKELKYSLTEFRAEMGGKFVYELKKEDYKKLRSGKAVEVNQLLINKYPHIFEVVKNGDS